MKSYSFYRFDTGLFTGKVRSTPNSRSRDAVPVPDGCGMVDGTYDHLSQRVDLESGEVVDWQPPRPDNDHEWVHDDEQGNRVRRWVLKPEVIERRARRAAALARIEQLESKEPRARRERDQGIAPSDADRAAGAMTLEEIWDEIASLQQTINGEKGTTAP